MSAASPTANPKIEESRIGSGALSIFAQSVNAEILRAHAVGPLDSGELQGSIGWAPQSTLRAALDRLCGLGALARSGSAAGPRGTTRLTAAGWELLRVAGALEHWLAAAPDGGLSLDDHAAPGVIRVLTAGWDAAMVRALAERPHALRELDGAIPHLGYQALKRRLAKLRSTRLVTPVGLGRGVPYVATDWLRRAVVPLTVGGRWELRHGPDGRRPTPAEIEAAFLLALPLIELPAAISHSLTLAALIPPDRSARNEPQLAGVTVAFERGKLASCGPEAAAAPGTWALGTAEQWLCAVIDGDDDILRFGGASPRLAKHLVKRIHRLFQPTRVADMRTKS